MQNTIYILTKIDTFIVVTQQSLNGMRDCSGSLIVNCDQSPQTYIHKGKYNINQII